MSTYQIDPRRDSRWTEFIARHPRASMFHTPAWLEALYRTYGYKPVVFTTAGPNSELTNGIVLCKIQSFLTGRRMVSLPFSDHCEPLVDNHEVLQEVANGIEQELRGQGWKFLEMRPLEPWLEPQPGFRRSESFVHHRLDTTKSLDALFHSFHKDCIQRKIRRASKEQLTYQCGNSAFLLKGFYRMFLGTRRRHQVPPQPFAWFRNLAAAFGDALQVRLALKEGRPIAGVLTIAFRKTLTYKYGCSNPAFNNLGGTPFLFWKAIEEATAAGMTELDLGRSDMDDPGLIEFKDRWGTTRTELTYWRYPASDSQRVRAPWTTPLVKLAFERMPDWLLVTSGRLLYRHMG